MHQCLTYCRFHASQLLFGLVTQRRIFPGARARCMMKPNNGCERDYAYFRSSNREEIKIICL